MLPSKVDSVAIHLESLRNENCMGTEYIAKLIPQRVHAKRRDLMQFRVAARDSKLVRKCFGIICAPLVYRVSWCNLSFHMWFRCITFRNFSSIYDPSTEYFIFYIFKFLKFCNILAKKCLISSFAILNATRVPVKIQLWKYRFPTGDIAIFWIKNILFLHIIFDLFNKNET